MGNAKKKEMEKPGSSSLLSLRNLLLISPLALLLIALCFFSLSPASVCRSFALDPPRFALGPSQIAPFDCRKCPQASPIFASRVEGLRWPFFYSLADLGDLPERPNEDISRILKGQLFRRPHVSLPIQNILGKQDLSRNAIVVDVGANVGMATFAAAAMGFRVLAFEPVSENLQRLCDGIFLNRAWDHVTLFAAAASDRRGNITFHKLVGRLDNSAVSAEGARMTFRANEEVEVVVPSVRVDDVVGEKKVALVKIDVQGWELHVLRGAEKVLAREKGEAPYLMYEEDERLLKASGTTAAEIRGFLAGLGYSCERQGGDAHCTKN